MTVVFEIFFFLLGVESGLYSNNISVEENLSKGPVCLSS